MGARCAGGSCVSAAGEVCGNGLDDDGDGLIDEDCGSACAADADCAAGELCVRGVCQPSGAAEVCDNGLDDDGDGMIDEGCPPPSACAADADCARGEVCVSGVCQVGTEICGNGIDDDHDGLVDEWDACPCASDADCAMGMICSSAGMCVGSDADGDGHAAPADCDDHDARVHPGAAESCNGLDDDCDGVIDEAACGAACRSDADCAMGEICSGGRCAAP